MTSTIWSEIQDCVSTGRMRSATPARLWGGRGVEDSREFGFLLTATRAWLDGMLVHDLRRTAPQDFRRAGASEGRDHEAAPLAKLRRYPGLHQYPWICTRLGLVSIARRGIGNITR